jgi:hypothetical protein
VRGVIERDWGRQLAQKRHNLPAVQNGPSGPRVQPHTQPLEPFAERDKKSPLPRLRARFVPLVFVSHPQDRSLPQRLPPTGCAARSKLLLLPPANLSLRSFVRPGRRLAGFGSTARGPPKKSLRDFATLANLGHFALRSA